MVKYSAVANPILNRSFFLSSTFQVNLRLPSAFRCIPFRSLIIPLNFRHILYTHVTFTYEFSSRFKFAAKIYIT